MLTPGSRIGPYTITGSLGAGGMGEVYRAHDARLGRDVALKILPDAWLGDPDRRARFEREARALAALNHPNIAAIYGVEDLSTSSGRALVLELVEGQTLADRLAAGAVPVPESLALAAQIADALDAAHERGIVHRDLKPANVKITPDGRAKVLDFGLAKSAGGDDSSIDFTHSPTLTRGATEGGVLLGTAAYMSPEQARGKLVDKRTDVWAFGCVVYDMLTGQPAFGRPTLTDTLAAIVDREPDWTALPAATPPAVRRMLRRCLEKDVKRRLRDIGDALADLHDSTADAPPEPVAIAAPRVVEYQRITDSVGMDEAPAMSPDGKMIAFVARADGRRHIWIRMLSGGAPLQVTRDDADHEHPRWVPDSSAIIYYTPSAGPDEQGFLWEISALGGPARPIVSATGGCDVSHDGRHVALFRSHHRKTEIVIAERSGGEERVVVSMSQAQPSYSFPRFSPDDQWLAFLGAAADFFQQRLYVLPVQGGDPSVIVQSSFLMGCSWLPDGSGLVYSSSAGSTVPYPPTFNVWAIGRDGSRNRQITFGDVSYVQPDVHRTGKLLACRVTGHSNLWKIPVSGTPLDNVRDAVQLTHQTGHVRTPSVSPDGRELVFLSDSGGHGNLWIMDLQRRSVRQLTFERDPAVTIGSPLWSPSGREIVFVVSRGDTGLSAIRPDGRGLRQITAQGFAACWSRDGRFVYYSTATEAGDWHTMKMPIDGGGPELVPGEQISRVAVTDSATFYYPARLSPELGGWDWEVRCVPEPGGAYRALARFDGSRVPVSPAFAHVVLSPDGQWLAMPLLDGVTANLWAIPTAGGPMRQLTDFGDRPIVIARSVSWAPDGRHLYAAVADTHRDVVLLDGLL